MVRSKRGFTIVEILIVIATMGILASIAIVGWNGLSAWSRDQARESDAKQWASTFELYKSRFVVYPDMPAADGTAPPQAIMRCLGEFTSGKCVQITETSTAKYINDSLSDPLNEQIKKVGNLLVNTGPVYKGLYAGPFVYISKSTNSGTGIVTVNAKFINFFENGCPSNFTREITQPSPSAPFTSLLNGIPNTVYVCGLAKTFTYNPS